MKKTETADLDLVKPLSVLPRIVPVQVDRPTQEDIPPTKAERDAVRRQVVEYLEEVGGFVPPIPMDELRQKAEGLLEAKKIDRKYLDFAAVVLNNEIWREDLATVPYDRRLLLLPKCLRVESHCPAPFDEFGLLCKKCGMCTIQELQEEAERLGYAVLVAEGSPIVMAIIETGKIEAIVGVSCLNVLERAFPYMEAAAIPGIALPLLQDDCKDTAIDIDWVWDVIHLTSEDKTRRMDLGGLRDTVDTWFTLEALAATLGAPGSRTEQIGHDWLARAGKRWRPFLSVAVHQALRANPGADLPADLKNVAVAVECFHKASLIHDDIEDGDARRYGERTLHEEHGVAVALNVGDYLLGEGYRLLANCEAGPEARARMLQVASRGHRTLSLGQGAELCWARAPEPLTSLQVLEIFRQKTAPAFEVALLLGSIHAGGDAAVEETLSRYSESLGIAYQIRDDLKDIDTSDDADDVQALRPTLPMALAHERARGEDKRFLDALWRRRDAASSDDAGSDDAGSDDARVRSLFASLEVVDRADELLEAYKEDAIRSLWKLENANLKGLLRRVIGKVFNDTEIKGWCNEFEARNASSSQAGAESA